MIKQMIKHKTIEKNKTLNTERDQSFIPMNPTDAQLQAVKSLQAEEIDVSAATLQRLTKQMVRRSIALEQCLLSEPVTTSFTKQSCRLFTRSLVLASGKQMCTLND
jgi:hypothetical protein